ncbi:hypothetical protein BH09BAC1_BH09BAC1_16470 [soil metagenome]
MKHLSLAALLLFITLTGFSQIIKVEGVTRTMSQGEQPGFAVTLPKADVKLVERAWEDAVRGNNKSKMVKGSNEWVTMGTLLPQVSQYTLDVYARPISTTEGVILEVFFRDVSGFIGAERNLIYPQAEKFVNDFARAQHKVTLENQLDAAEDVLKSLEKESSSLSKDLEKLNSCVTENTMGVNDNKNEIATNDADQERLRQQIQAQKQKILDAAKLSPEAKKAEEKNLNSLEKDLKSLMKDKEKLLQKNVKSDSDIRDTNQEIKNKEVEVSNKQKQIAEQKGKIKELQDELVKFK